MSSLRPAPRLPHPWRRLRVVLACAGLALAVLPVALATAVVRQVRPYLYHDPAAVPTRAVAIVPGARVFDDGTPSPPLLDRLESARALYAAGRVRRVLVSGDHGHPGYDEVNAMRRWLVAHGVASEDVVLDHAGFRTLDTMERAARVFGVTEAIVCTQRFHLARAVFLARRAGIDAVGLEADRHAYAGRRLDALRERAAVVRAVLDAYVLGTDPRVLGPPVPVMGDATASWDEQTVRDAAGDPRLR